MLEKTVCNDSKYLRELVHEHMSQTLKDAMTCSTEFQRKLAKTLQQMTSFYHNACHHQRRRRSNLSPRGSTAKFMQPMLRYTQTFRFPEGELAATHALQEGYSPISTGLKFRRQFMPTQLTSPSIGISVKGFSLFFLFFQDAVFLYESGKTRAFLFFFFLFCVYKILQASYISRR